MNRDTVRARLPGVDSWIVESLIDAFEPAALEAADLVEKKRKPATEKTND